MQVNINGRVYNIGNKLKYARKNPDGAYQDKLKYRLAQQNNLILDLLSVIAQEITYLTRVINSIVSTFIWAADNNTIMAADDDTILVFYSYSTKSDSNT